MIKNLNLLFFYLLDDQLCQKKIRKSFHELKYLNTLKL